MSDRPGTNEFKINEPCPNCGFPMVEAEFQMMTAVKSDLGFIDVIIPDTEKKYYICWKCHDESDEDPDIIWYFESNQKDGKLMQDKDLCDITLNVGGKNMLTLCPDGRIFVEGVEVKILVGDREPFNKDEVIDILIKFLDNVLPKPDEDGDPEEGPPQLEMRAVLERPGEEPRKLIAEEDKLHKCDYTGCATYGEYYVHHIRDFYACDEHVQQMKQLIEERRETKKNDKEDE